MVWSRPSTAAAVSIRRRAVSAESAPAGSSTGSSAAPSANSIANHAGSSASRAITRGTGTSLPASAERMRDWRSTSLRPTARLPGGTAFTTRRAAPSEMT